MKLGRVHVIAVSILVVVPRLTALADTLLVPSHAFPTIQSAIDGASDGDEVVVAPGTYHETINFNGKAITLRSSDGPAVTTIDGTGLNDSVVKCVSGEGPDTVFAGFTITGGTGDVLSGFQRGGGMFLFQSSPALTNNRFISNTAFRGGGLAVRLGSPLISGCLFQDNLAEYGGGLELSASNAMVESCSFVGNTADGGGAVLTVQGSPKITACVFDGNEAVQTYPIIFGTGGAILNYVSNPTIVSSAFRSNDADEGGAIYNQDSMVTVENCLFDRNYATASGGGIASEISQVTVSACTFKSNDGGGFGGAIFDGVGTLKVERSHFTSNSSNAFGGAVSGLFSYGAEFRSCVFQKNGAGTHGGALYFVDDVEGIVDHCTFADNHAPFGAAGAFGDPDYESLPSTFSVTNSILHDDGEELWIDDDSVVAVGYSNVRGGFPGSGNIDASPRYYGRNDFRLWPNSPCINAGDPGFVAAESESDILGSSRLEGCRTDLGAYEAAVQVAFGDFDGNRRIDLRDFAAFQSCMGMDGSSTSIGHSCVCVFDGNDDSLVDVDDYLRVHAQWGAGRRPPPTIAWILPAPGQWVVNEGGVTELQVGFSEPVLVPSDAVEVRLGGSIAQYETALDETSMVLAVHFTLPVQDDRLTLVLDYSITGLTGTELDGEIYDPYHAALPSGDGVPGGQAVIRIHVLQGDANRDGMVDAIDSGLLEGNLNHCIGVPGYDPNMDLNSDGCIDGNDLIIVEESLGNHLPPTDGSAPTITSVTTMSSASSTVVTARFSELFMFGINDRCCHLAGTDSDVIVPYYITTPPFANAISCHFQPPMPSCMGYSFNVSNAVSDDSGELLASPYEGPCP